MNFAYDDCGGRAVLGSMELASSSFTFTGRGGICFITSGESFNLKTNTIVSFLHQIKLD